MLMMADPMAAARLRILLSQAEAWAEAALPAAKASAHPSTDPGEKDKLRAEGKLTAVLHAYFGRLAKKAAAKLKSNPPAKKAGYVDDEFDDGFFDDEEFVAALTRILMAAKKDGALQLADMVNLKIDQSAVNKEAAASTEKYAFQLVQGLTDTAREQLRTAVKDFINSPGMTIGDVIERLPFDEQRAALVATTEITRAYADGQKLGGEQLKKDWPDVPVTKMWHTNEDDLVCPICDPLDGVTVDQEETFTGGDGEELDGPPGHPGCRCWVSYRTNITGAAANE